MNIYKSIYKEIKRAKKIVIARHIGPDPDALGSSLGLKDIILNTFPNKEVYVVGSPASKFKYLGNLDKFDNSMYDALLIITDTPNFSRVDGCDIRRFKKSIKIDHHPFLEKMCTIEWIDESASSASQMIMELVNKTKLKMSKEAAEKLYLGLVADTNRFMFAYSTAKTFSLVSNLLETTGIDITKIYNKLYERPYKEIKFKGYVSQNFNISKNKCGHIKIKDEIIKQFNVDAATAGNVVNEFNHITEMLIWVTITEDIDLGSYRISIRSRGPIINDIAAKYNGGGHIYASGVRLKTDDEINDLLIDLDKRAEEYIKENEPIER